MSAMKILVLLFAALLVAGCGEKSSSEGSESASEKPTASNESADASLWEATLLGEIEPAKKAIADGADVNAGIGSGRHQGMTPLDITGVLSEAATSPNVFANSKARLMISLSPISSANTAARPRRNWKLLVTKPSGTDSTFPSHHLAPARNCTPTFPGPWASLRTRPEKAIS